MSFDQFIELLFDMVQDVLQIGNQQLFPGFNINQFWVGLAIMSLLLSSLLVVGRSLTSAGSQKIENQKNVKKSKTGK